MNKVVEKAKEFASHVHANRVNEDGSIGHFRKYDKKPYFTHLDRVAHTLMGYGYSSAMIAAAYLHDTVEDTETTIEDIRREFGTEIADLVEGLTDISKPEDGNRAKRKEIDRNHTLNSCGRVQTIKCADCIDNTFDIMTHDPNGFGRKYIREIYLLLSGMTKADKEIHERALNQVIELAKEHNIKLG